MLHLTESDVRPLLPMTEAIERLRFAFESLARGEAQSQPRRRLTLPSGSVLHSMAGACGKYFGTKYYSTNRKHGAYFFFTLFDAESAAPLAMMEANYLGQIRTGAATGYAASLLANPKAATLAIVGSGFQARTQVEAIRAVCPIREVRTWSRDAEKCSRFAAEIGGEAAPTAQEAVRGADIVVTATNAKDPVIEADWVKRGSFVAAVGSNAATRRELPAELVRGAAIVVTDSMEQARIEAGDLILADCWSNAVELKDVRRSYRPEEIVIFKSVGIGLEDVAVAGWVYERAVERGVGRYS
jgi:ornithine cyclodeaminase/alanine dehydrogenase-like protein (mu-crystallin family)